MTETTQRADGAAVEQALERAALHAPSLRVHWALPHSDEDVYEQRCSVCGGRWPCDAVVLAVEVARLHEVIEDLRGDIGTIHNLAAGRSLS